MKKLHARWSDKVQFVDVLARQAHPGPAAPAYRSVDQKMRDAERYKDEHKIPWPVIVDDLEGTVHRIYGGLADPTYLIDVDGKVSFYNMWAHVPTLHEAIDMLFKQGARGVVENGIDKLPHPLASMTDGWEAIRRGLPQSFIELETAFPGAASSIWLGHQLRPLLAPLTLRAEPLPLSVKLAFGFGAAAVLILIARRLARVR
jgi:hypothetical protein